MDQPIQVAAKGGNQRGLKEIFGVFPNIDVES
jgi:hypothetical protein